MLSKKSRICCWSIRKSSMKPDSFRTVILRHGPRYYGAEQVDAAAERWGEPSRRAAVIPHRNITVRNGWMWWRNVAHVTWTPLE